VGDLVSADYNPPGRVKNVEKLLDEVVAVGEKFLVPLHVGPDGVLVDGHRRLCVAVALGIGEVKVYRYSGDRALIEQLYVILNITARPVTPADRLTAELLGSPKFGGTAGDIRILSKNFSPSEIQSMCATKSVAPTKVRLTNAIATLCEPDDRAKHRAVFRDVFSWLELTGSQQKAKDLQAFCARTGKGKVYAEAKSRYKLCLQYGVPLPPVGYTQAKAVATIRKMGKARQQVQPSVGP
jgi:hypothetical protein